MEAVKRFVDEHPASARLASEDGQRLVHASGFSASTGAKRPEEAARTFLSLDAHGGAFGVTQAQALIVKAAPGAGELGAVRLERTIDGLPVFGGDLVVGVDAQSRVFLVNGTDVGPTVSGRHAVGEDAAQSAALASFPGGVRGAGPAVVTSGWQAFGSTVRPVYRVDFIAQEPAGDWRVFVDGETGRALLRDNLRASASAPGMVFEVSPAESIASACPLSGAGHSFCASPAAVTIPNLVTGADLTGTQTSVYNCGGAEYPASAADVPGTCSPVVSLSGAFSFAVDNTYQSTTDNFAAVMAYYHLDKHASFLRSLDPTLPTGAGNPAPGAIPPGQGRALRGSLPALVNLHQAGKPFENAQYTPLLDAMVFGQGATVDFAYDATVMYHELTHGVVWAWGGFNFTTDALGSLWEPKALNEGTADAMAMSEVGRSGLGSFIGAMQTPPLPALRDLNDPSATRSCQGNGTHVAGTSVINGLDGEEHDDGEIWNGFFWEVYQGLKTANIKACGGLCDAGPALQYKALQLAGGTSPTFSSYWQTMKAAAGAMFPTQTGVPAYVDCVAKRRGFDKCDRTVLVYAGEKKIQYVRNRFSPFQVALPVTGSTQFSVCSASGSAATLYARFGQPAQITAIDPATGMPTVTADGSVSLSQACSGGTSAFTLTSPGAGTWYLLVDSPVDIYRFDAGAAGMATRPAATTPPTCTVLSIAPASAIPPKGTRVLSASGGSGSGFTWSLATNNSGASINPTTGAYTAGANGSASDVVQVADSLGSTATRTVTVGAAVTISPVAAAAAPNGGVTFVASGGSGTGFTWSLTVNNSGGSVGATTGVYTAGVNGSVTDVVQVTDSLGNSASTNVTVTAAVPPSAGSGGGKSGGCGTSGGTDISILALGVAFLLRARSMKGALPVRAGQKG